MLTYIGIAIFVLFMLYLLFASFMWTRGGLGKGRRYGNKIAKHLGMSNNFFHSVLESGVTGPSLLVLAALDGAVDGAGLTIEQASIQLAPSLERGLIALENRFGRQEGVLSPNRRKFQTPIRHRYCKVLIYIFGLCTKSGGIGSGRILVPILGG